MARFDFIGKHFTITDAHSDSVDLVPQEALALLEWLSDKRAALQLLVQQDAERSESTWHQIEIHLQPQDLIHLDELQAVIPHINEHVPMTTTLISPGGSVTEHAIELLKEFQIEYKIHPLLEDSNEFAQG